jgi:hypothetical protein
VKKSEINIFFDNIEADEQTLTCDFDFSDFVDRGDLGLLIAEILNTVLAP